MRYVSIFVRLQVALKRCKRSIRGLPAAKVLKTDLRSSDPEILIRAVEKVA